MDEPNNDEVICPNCAHQFRAIPVNVQLLMLDVGFEPPFMEAPPLAKLQARFTPPAPAPQQAQDIAEASGGAEGGPEEDRIEAAFWRFDARHKGYGQWRQAPMSERDAFKAEMRNALHAEAVRAEMRMVVKGWRKQGPQQAQETSPTEVHSCSYFCDRPACIKAQRDELRDRATSLPPQGAASPDPQLLKFYAVSDYPSLVAAMLHHIEKLQAKLPKDGQPLLTRVRA